ncbi:MAG: cell division topological specificity factor MinE [Synergistaceae bacterium]|nr:cell division topological specificity factor MinE [Synergistaceae bacterium]
MDFFKKFFGGDKDSSGQVAKDRLRIVLMHDRTDITPQLLEDLRDEIIDVLTKYMEIDEKKIDISLDKDDQRAVALVANIPVIKIKRGKVDVN